jgi:serine protease Do
MEKKRSFTPWVGGALVGVLISASFWAGHEFSNGSQTNLAAPISKALKNPLVQSTPSSNLLLGENTIADIAKQASDSVVNIDISKNYVVPDYESPLGMGSLPFFFGGGDMAPRQPEMRKFQARGCGSGVIFRSDGYILTNNHVVGQADDIKVTLNDKRQFKGKVVGRDSFTDLAVVKIDAQSLPAAHFGTSKNLRPGDWAIAIGSPLGLDHSVSFGIISALGRSLDGLNNNAELIQTDAAINPGNSGGPLINIHGDVIGLNVAIRGDGQNIGFAIPVDVVKDIAQQLLNKGTIARAYLGIYMQNLDPELAGSLGLPVDTKGVLVGRTMPDGPAAKAGIESGDVIQRIDGSVVGSAKEVQSCVLKHKPNDKLTLLISRNGSLKPVSVMVGDRPTKDEG